MRSCSGAQAQVVAGGRGRAGMSGGSCDVGAARLFRDGSRWIVCVSVASLHHATRRPAYAIALQAVLASILVMVGSFNEIMSYFVFVVIVFIALTVVALFKLRRTQPNKAGYLTPVSGDARDFSRAAGWDVVFVGQRQAETGAFRRRGCILGISGLFTSVSW